MATLSFILSEYLANESKKVARRLGVSRTQFIRQAITHELKTFNLQLDQKSIV